MGRLLFALMCFALAFSDFTGGIQADDVMTVELLLAKIASASGMPPASREEHIHYTRAGVAGDEQIVRDGDDVRETFAYGPLQSAAGSYQKQAWHENYNGQVVLDQPEPGLAVKETYTTTLRRVNVPFDAFVIERLDSARSGTKEYVDPATFRIVRRDAIGPAQITVTSYDDFRTVDGYTMPWHWVADDGHPEDRAEYRVTSLAARPIEKSEIDIPSPRRALGEFPAGETSVDVPVTFVNDSFIVRAVINGRGLDFLLDTGAAGIVINDDVARQLGLREFANTTNPGMAARVNQSTVVIPQMNVGDLQLHDVAAATVPGTPGDEYEGTKVVGLLGFDFIAELLLRLDYEHGRVTAAAPGPTPPPHGERSIALDIRLGNQQPMTTVLVNGSPGERFVIDTGNRGGFLIFDYFARRYPGALVDLGGGDDRQRHMSFTGIGGRTEVDPYRLARVQMGSIIFTDFFGYRVTKRTSYAGNIDGLIGTTFLRNFNVLLDYEDSQIVLELNGRGAAGER